MLEAIAKRVFGSANERFLKGLHKAVVDINALEPEIESLSDEPAFSIFPDPPCPVFVSSNAC